MLPTAEAKGLPRLDVPVVLIGKLAVDRSVQGQGLGALLLVDALRRSLQISEQVGIGAVEVDAIDDAARNFYLKFGFRSFAGRSSASISNNRRGSQTEARSILTKYKSLPQSPRDIE